MTKQELIDAVHAKTNNDITKKATGDVIDAIFYVIAKEVKTGGAQAIHSFGTFEKRHRKARKGVNPATGSELLIPASNTVGFKPAAALKKSVNG